MTQNNILIIAGEPSGDLHAARLVRDLKSLDSNLEFFGLGGRLSKDAGVDTIFDISKLALVGLAEVLKNIFTVGKVFKGILKRVDQERPCLAILVDYPGFNLRLARELKKRSIPVVYYISPQVWAWGRDRIKIIKECVTKILVFFKFEEDLYKTYGIDAEFVGHPLLGTVKASLSKSEALKKYDFKEGSLKIVLLPGSRATEIKAIFPTMVSAAQKIKEKAPNAQFIIARYEGLPLSMYEDIIKDSGLDIRIASGDTYNALNASDFAIVTSGTATLETAIIGTPLIITYKANLLTYIAYKLVATIPFIGIVNIIAGKEIAPEFIQYAATPQNMADTVMSIVSDKSRMAGMREELRKVKDSLGYSEASMRSARAIIKLLQ